MGVRWQCSVGSNGEVFLLQTQVPKITVIIGGSYGAGQLLHVRARIQPALPVHLAQQPHLRHGRRAGRRRARTGVGGCLLPDQATYPTFGASARPCDISRRRALCPCTRPRSAQGLCGCELVHVRGGCLLNEGVLLEMHHHVLEQVVRQVPPACLGGGTEARAATGRTGAPTSRPPSRRPSASGMCAHHRLFIAPCAVSIGVLIYAVTLWHCILALRKREDAEQGMQGVFGMHCTATLCLRP